MNKILKSATIAAMTAIATVSSAFAVEWQMPTPYAEAHFHTRNIQMFADEVKEKTNGELVIVVHPNGSLFEMPEIKRAVQQGLVPIGEINFGAYANENPYFAVDTIPFLATSYDKAHMLWDLTRPKIAALLDGQNIMPLYSVPFPPMGLISKEPFTDISKFKGMRFRSFGKNASRFGEIVEAVPTVIQASEVAQAFSLGTVDAMLTSASTGVATQAWDYAGYFAELGMAHAKNLVIVNKDAFNGLSEATRKIIIEAAQNAEKRGWEFSEEEGKTTSAKLREAGMTVEKPSPEFAAQLREVGNQMSREWAAGVGPDGEAIVNEMTK